MEMPIIKRPIFIVGVILLAFVLWGSEYFSRTLWEPDEARYVYVAREMRTSSHWLVPHRNGKYYAHKPPLMFWMQNAASVTTGGVINQVSGRLPSLLGAILSLLAISGLASLWKQRDAAWRVILILPTVYLFWKVCGMGQIDALLCGLEMTALYLLFKSDDETGNVWHRIFAYLFMGLAVITKGPVGYLVPLGAYVTAQLVSGNKGQLKRWHFLWGFLIAMLPLGLWLLAAWRHGAPDGYFNELLFDQNVGRAAGTKIHGHHRPFWYFISHFLSEFMPWILFLFAASVALIKGKDKKEVYRKLFGIIGFIIVFFSLSVTKRNIYILLAYPAAALIVALGWDELKLLNKRWLNITVYSTLALLFVGGVAALGAVVYSMLPDFGWGKLPIAGWRILPVGVVLLGGSVYLMKLYRKEALTNKWLIIFCLVLFLNQLAITSFIYAGINPLKSPLELQAVYKEYLSEGQSLLLYKTRGEIMSLYCNTIGKELYSRGEMLQAFHQQCRGLMVVPTKYWDEIKNEPAIKGRENFFRMGHKKFYWVPFDLSE